MSTNGTTVQQTIQEQIARLRLQEDRCRREREILQRTLRELVSLDEPQSGNETGTKAPRQAFNRPVLVSILRDAGESLRASEIGRQAHGSGLIASARGLAGVQSIVSTVLRRNEKKTFVRLSPGLWDLQERHATNGARQQLRRLILT